MQLSRQAWQALARSARAGRLYARSNQAYRRLFEDLSGRFATLLEAHPEVRMEVTPDAIVVDDEPVLTEAERSDSIPFTFYRDGVRRLDILRGLTARELTGLVETTSQGLFAQGFGQDVASLLWRLDLAHVRYVVVDTSIVAAGGGNGDGPPLADQIDALLTSLYGSSAPGEGSLSLHLDEADLPAQIIAGGIDPIADMAPGLFPARAFERPPAYAPAFHAEIDGEGREAVEMRGLQGVVDALDAPLPLPWAGRLGDALLDLLDTALMEQQFERATRIVRHVRASEREPSWVAAWLGRAASETRTRHAIDAYEHIDRPALRLTITAYFRALGAYAVEPILALLPRIDDASLRRPLSDLALEVGIPNPRAVIALLDGARREGLREAAYILCRMPRGAHHALDAARHPNPAARAMVAEQAHVLGRSEAEPLLSELLPDPTPEVRIAVARALTRIKGPFAEKHARHLADRSQLEGQPEAVKRAVLIAYAILAQEQAVPQLTRYLRDSEAVLAGRDTEEAGRAAAWGLAQVRSVTAVERLKRATESRHRKLGQTARRALAYMQEHT